MIIAKESGGGMISVTYLRGIVFGMVCFSVFIGCDMDSNFPGIVYTDPQYGFRIMTPATGWSVSQDTGIKNVLVVIRSENAVDGFIPNITISIEPLAEMMTAKEYGKRNLSFLLDQDYTLIYDGTSVINRNTLYELVCTTEKTMPPLKIRYLCMVRQRIGYIVTSTVPHDHYDGLRGDLDSMIGSFRFM